jgi:hypothetical protein
MLRLYGQDVQCSVKKLTGGFHIPLLLVRSMYGASSMDILKAGPRPHVVFVCTRPSTENHVISRGVAAQDDRIPIRAIADVTLIEEFITPGLFKALCKVRPK